MDVVGALWFRGWVWTCALQIHGLKPDWMAVDFLMKLRKLKQMLSHVNLNTYLVIISNQRIVTPSVRRISSEQGN